MLIDAWAAAAGSTDPTEGYAIIALAGAGWLLSYAVACWIWPFRNCRRCSGTARIKSPTGRAFRPCRRCQASGRRLRAGRWVFNYFYGKRKDAS